MSTVDMSTVEENKARLADAFEKWNACKGADPSCWTSIMDEEVSFTSLANGAHGFDFTVQRKSRDEIGAYFEGLTSAFSMDEVCVSDFIAEGDRVVAIGHCAWTSKATGTSFVSPYLAVARFRDGLIVEAQEYYDTATLAAAAQPA